MQIPKEILSESNYTGSRLVKVTNEKVKEFQTMLDGYQKDINPILDKLNEEYYKIIDPMYKEVTELQEKSKAIKDRIKELTDKFTEDIKAIEETEQKATLIKNKMTPIILNEVKEQLGEFEIARHTKVIGDDVYVEIFDEVEEKIKQLRSAKK